MRYALVVLALACRPPADPSDPATPTVFVPVPPTPLPPAPPPDPGPTRLINDRAYLPAAVQAIDAAVSEVRVAQFVIYDASSVQQVLGALERAAARGVAVRVLADEEGSETRGILDRLAQAGVQTSLDSRNTVLHSKLIVADGVALVGSHNLTHAALASNHEAAALIADPEIAGWYADWFDALWDAPDAWPAIPPLAHALHTPLSDLAVSVALRGCVDGAVDEIELVLYALAWDPDYPGSDVDLLLTSIEAAIGRGVDVRITLDRSPWIVSNGINDAAIARLEAAGADVGPAPAGVTTHAKLLRCDDALIVSDANWSHSGLALMRGTSLRTTDAALVDAARAWAATLR